MNTPQNNGQNNGQFVRPDVYGSSGTAPAAPNPSATGQFATRATEPPRTPRPRASSRRPATAPPRTRRPPASSPSRVTAAARAPRRPASSRRPATATARTLVHRPVRAPGAPQQRSTRPQEPEALPPATGPGDGRTPLYDTLETNWFHGQANGSQNGSPNGAHNGAQNNGVHTNGSQPSQQPPQTPTAPPQRSAAAPASANWRTSPNDDLVRQAERVRQPSAGGVTTSGLPRRVPRANLVAGTAQQQQHQTGPQVSRAPDDVRGRLTNLRRGIQQGRQAGTGQTGSFPSPTHQQER
ncbi:hypothetical protein O1M63_36430 [Streptomyces mirabilis]|nr:hypothetical protein [Streptomyces mirabilis]